MKAKTSIETEKLILDLRLQGDSYKVIIQKTGASSSTISRILRKHALTIAMDRDDYLYNATSQFRIIEHVQNRYLARNLASVEDELSQRSLKGIPTEKLQAIARNLRSDMQKLQEKREQQLEKAHEMFERDAEKRKESKEAVEEQDDQPELAQIPIIPLQQPTSTAPKAQDHPGAKAQPETSAPANTPQEQTPVRQNNSGKPSETQPPSREPMKNSNPFNPTQPVPKANPGSGQTEPIQKAA